MEHKKLKIVLFILLIIIIIAIVTLIGIYNEQIKATVEKMANDNEKIVKQENENKNEIQVVPTMNVEVKENAAWCGTFQLIWNDLKENIANQDIVFTPQQTDLAKDLNKGEFNTSMLSEEYYYKKYGHATLELKQEIEQGIKEKFGETSNILNDFNWENADPSTSYFLYAMLKRKFEFEQAFDVLENGKFGNYEDVAYFGVKPQENQTARKQVEVLYYHSKNDFAILLNTKQQDQVILSKGTKGRTFNEIYENVQEQQGKYEGDRTVKNSEEIKIPNLSIDEKVSFKELENKDFSLSNGEKYYISKTLQTIQFTLDKEGGEIKSEAGAMVDLKAAFPVEKEVRNFSLDDTFTIFLRQKDKEKPYFAAKIKDITKFQ